MAVDHWRPYLQLAEFIIQTDHRSLVYLDDQRLNTYWQQKAMTKLMALQYKICYKQGSTNKVADALSRVPPNSETELLSVSVVQPTWLLDLQESYKLSEEAQKWLTSLAINNTQDDFSLVQGIIKYKNRVWLDHSHLLQSQIIHALHSSLVGGHSGILTTYMRIKKLFFWTHLKKRIQEFVTNCTVCQQAKTEKVPYPGLLQPLAVPDFAWHTVTMDFIEGLPKSSHYDCILVVVDKFSKYAHFLKLCHPFSASKIAKLYMEQIYKLHAMPSAIISDRDKIFTSQFWQELF